MSSLFKLFPDILIIKSWECILTLSRVIMSFFGFKMHTVSPDNKLHSLILMKPVNDICLSQQEKLGHLLCCQRMLFECVRALLRALGEIAGAPRNLTIFPFYPFIKEIRIN